MVIVETAIELARHVGRPLGATDWVSITQEQIDAFAELTGDDHWIHVDVARAARARPDGKTIAHGLYLLSLIPRLQRQLFRIERRGEGLNYGYDRVRFTAPVPVGSRIRLAQTVTEASRARPWHAAGDHLDDRDPGPGETRAGGRGPASDRRPAD